MHDPDLAEVPMSSQKADQEELARLAVLRRYRILDTEPEQRFDDLTMLATHVCAAPISLITLVDAERQWFKSKVGTTVPETARSISFCDHAMRQRSLFIIPDTHEDPRFKDNPMVAAHPRIRFYAGASLISREGHPLGSLCVIDYVPRKLTPEQAGGLDALRRQVESQLELRRNLAELEAALAARDRAEEMQAQLVDDLRTSLDNVEKLTELIPLCKTCQLNMTIPADPAAISKVSEGLERLLHEKGWIEGDIIRVDLAVREALANAIRHGCAGDRSKHVQCTVTFESPQEVVIVIRDPGPGFDANTVPDPMAAENMFKSSGRGVYLINQLMDEVGFRDGGREVHMRKKAEPAVEGGA